MRHPGAPKRWRQPRLRLVTAAVSLVGVVVLGGCASTQGTASHETERLSVITTTGILADLARNVGGDRISVTSIVPDGADPHSYEPTLRDVRDIVYADAAFSNYLMLEEQSIIRALDANLKPGVPNISLAERSVSYAAEIRPLVEDLSLDTVWLGMRVLGDGDAHGADRSSRIAVTATDIRGPGDLNAYLTGTFGEVAHYVSTESHSGVTGSGVSLPPAAHTHLSWAFSEPGVYRLELTANLTVGEGIAPIPLASGEVTFAVGIDPHTVAASQTIGAARTVIDQGHADIVVDLDGSTLGLVADRVHTGEGLQQQRFELNDVVVSVPTAAIHDIPADPAFRFLGRPGQPIYQLPQAVLGKHVHGEIDPHLWHNVRNAMAYVEVIRDTLIDVDPAGEATYRANAQAYLATLTALDEEVRERILEIPARHRTLITTHDAFGYLGDAYGVRIAGFVTPNPATEPSLAERKRLAQTVRDLEVPAVFLEPNLAQRSSTLTEVAREHGIAVCPIYGDAFDETVTSYVDMMRFNATSLLRCLGTTHQTGRS